MNKTNVEKSENDIFLKNRMADRKAKHSLLIGSALVEPGSPELLVLISLSVPYPRLKMTRVQEG